MPERNELNWVAAASEGWLSETSIRRLAAWMSGQPLCIHLIKKVILRSEHELTKKLWVTALRCSYNWPQLGAGNGGYLLAQKKQGMGEGGHKLLKLVLCNHEGEGRFVFLST